MKRMHVHVAVNDLGESVKFYSGMFGTEPTVLKPDYAKWMLDDPRVNFAISQRGAAVGLNHLGIQVESDAELDEMQHRLQALDPELQLEAGTACCYAKSDKYWINDPTGIPWEAYHTLDSIPVFGQPKKTDAAACCVPGVKVAPASHPETRSCCSKTNQQSGCC